MNKLMRLSLFTILLNSNILICLAVSDKNQQTAGQTITQEAKEIFESFYVLKDLCDKKLHSEPLSQIERNRNHEECLKRLQLMYNIELENFKNKYSKYSK